MNYKKVEKYVLLRLENNLPKSLSYHNLAHTVETIIAVENLAKGEGVSGDDLILLKIGALFHDTGFLSGNYSNHELESISIAGDLLDVLRYTNGQIEIVSGIILATKLPQNPKTELEKIMCDADLDNFGKDDFFEKSELYKTELAKQDIIKTDEKTDKGWYTGVLELLKNHNYFTKSARKLRNKGKKQNINIIYQLLSRNMPKDILLLKQEEIPAT